MKLIERRKVPYIVQYIIFISMFMTIVSSISYFSFWNFIYIVISYESFFLEKILYLNIDFGKHWKFMISLFFFFLLHFLQAWEGNNSIYGKQFYDLHSKKVKHLYALSLLGTLLFLYFSFIYFYIYLFIFIRT